ncbi:hypothetical protein [Streptomyces canarius]|uniref:Integrase n=1 Tax=Streptomyces canarius TaxID=285453 RepID=A0ABQ3DB93_9ACTN|nr:hypothetical protein [Streptomyces canarius]GHA71771.1 hypothetical protein GCM10010345_88520 [Streptomyces canarius]
MDARERPEPGEAGTASGHRAVWAQSQISQRVRSAAWRLKELERTGWPTAPSVFTADFLAARVKAHERSLLVLHGVRVPGRLTLDGLEV